MKVITADEAGALIKDNASLLLCGLAISSLAEEVLKGIENTFMATGHPQMVTTWACGAIGNSGEAGMKHFAHKGLIKRVVAGHFGQTGKEMMRMIFDNEVEAYNFPQGSLSHLTRQIANKSPGLLTQVGLGTFVDPRQEGGKMNACSSEDLVKLVNFQGEEWLYYAPPRVDVAIIRGTMADENGNITLEKEGVILEQLSAALAAKRWGGIVICQVERIVKAGTMLPKSVKVPGHLVDFVVLSSPENHMQSISTQYNPALSGEVRIPTESMAPMPLDERKVIARRAAMELTPGAQTNLGIGIPAGIPAVAAEEGVAESLTLSVESGVNGGIPAQGGDFALAYNAESIIEQSSQFDFYDGGGLDTSFLGLAQTDAHGNVNVSKFNGRPVGCGGFINITRSTKKLVFCGAFSAGGLKVAVGEGKLTILQEGKSSKFVEQVEQITFNGHDAALREQEVLFVTERAVFKLCEEGLELLEIAPGVDLERNVLAHMAFKPIIRDLKTMDPGLFSAQWGGLAKAIQH
jgi:propionate CoA-transferase